jgi:cytochrome P450/NADPH-cytochrome P450 reductase
VLLQEILSGYVELAQPATKRNLQTLLEAAGDGDGDDNDRSRKAPIENLIENYKTAVVDKRLSVLDILVTNPSLKISLGAFINMLPTMRVRQYSISSSPLWNPSHCTLTISVVSAPAFSGTGTGTETGMGAGGNQLFLGVASNFLAELKPGDLVQVAVRPSTTTTTTTTTAFKLPADPSVPLVLFCAGSGLAPMRGFIQERATQIQSGGRKDIGKVLLFYGCRHPEQDYLYSDAELKEWARIGAVDVRPAFSRAKEHSEGCRYVQELVFSHHSLTAYEGGLLMLPCRVHRRILHDAADIDVFFKQGAKVRIQHLHLLLSLFFFVFVLCPSGLLTELWFSFLLVAGAMLPRGSRMLVSH